MPKTVSRTLKDIVIGDIRTVEAAGTLDDPTKILIFATADLRDDGTGDVVDTLSFQVFPNSGTLTALSNILKTDILSDANAALQARGDTDVKLPAP
jgi:hypothetical protein